MQPRRQRLAILTVVTMLVCAAVGGGCRRAGEIRIGYLGANLTDGGAEEMTLLGAGLAVEQINSAGGVFARTLVLSRATYRGDKQQAVQEATRLCVEEKVTAIIGYLPTAIMRVVSPVSQANRVVAVSTGAIGKGVEDAGDCVFRLLPSEDSVAPLVARFLTAGCGWRRFALVADADETGAAYVLDLYRSDLTANGGQIVATVTVDADAPAKPAANLAAKDINAVVYAGSPANAAAFIEAFRAAGGAEPVYVAGAGVSSTLLKASTGSQSIIVADGADPGQPGQAQRKFHADFVAKYGREPDAAAERGYDAVRLIVEAMLGARGTKTDLYVPALATTSNRAGVSGNLTYLTGTRAPVYEPLHVLGLADGEVQLLATLTTTPSQ
ncbi:MAG: ABC transporter substrate-binding protein [Chloroflexota bacterium]